LDNYYIDIFLIISTFVKYYAKQIYTEHDYSFCDESTGNHIILMKGFKGPWFNVVYIICTISRTTSVSRPSMADRRESQDATWISSTTVQKWRPMENHSMGL